MSMPDGIAGIVYAGGVVGIFAGGAMAELFGRCPHAACADGSGVYDLVYFVGGPLIGMVVAYGWRRWGSDWWYWRRFQRAGRK